MQLHLANDRGVGDIDAGANLLRAKGIDWVYRGHAIARSSGLGIETGRAVATAQNMPRPIRSREIKHAPIFAGAAPPGDNLI
jgi:hypothetical protein